MKNIYHLWTPDNQQIILTCEADFKTAMTIFALCAAMSPPVKVLTFELMSNHIHVTLEACEEDARHFFALFKKHLVRWLKAAGRPVDLSGFDCSLRRLTNRQDIKTVISYNNRNGFLVNPNETPFSYRWGAGRFFFNPDSRLRYENESVKMTMSERRDVLHSHAADRIDTMRKLDGYVCPLCFCDIPAAEAFFFNASNYFYEISRNIESQKAIAQEIGERIMYTDDELFRVVQDISKASYGQSAPSLLSRSAKTEVARQVHYGWGASKKQLHRMLKIEMSVLDDIFRTPINREIG